MYSFLFVGLITTSLILTPVLIHFIEYFIVYFLQPLLNSYHNYNKHSFRFNAQIHFLNDVKNNDLDKMSDGFESNEVSEKDSDNLSEESENLSEESEKLSEKDDVEENDEDVNSVSEGEGEGEDSVSGVGKMTEDYISDPESYSDNEIKNSIKQEFYLDESLD